MSSPMPGWYPDPEAPERQRFWDGTKWTEARAYPAAAVGAEPAQQPAAKESRSAWLWIAVIALALAALLAAAFFITNRSSEPEQLPEPTPVPASPTPTGQPTPTETPPVTPPTTPPVTPPVTPT